MSTRGNPFAELERLFERMSRQFDDASRMWESEGPFGRWASEAESMAIDLVDRDDEFVATVDLPGFERDDVDIQVTDHTLRIEAEHEEILDEEEERFIRHERRHESTKRSIRVPEEVDKDGVKAHMKNGVLTVTLPKLETEEARKIEIEGT
ncbi:Hsp20/alpha crystallin family protein (plasmid) [Haloarcula marismortui]|uniref:Hsp20/alpha crystallin family protein n=1 Tax=Haloarcula marismortui TaxID=2238 RepID=UPI003C76A21F